MIGMESRRRYACLLILFLAIPAFVVAGESRVGAGLFRVERKSGTLWCCSSSRT